MPSSEFIVRLNNNICNKCKSLIFDNDSIKFVNSNPFIASRKTMNLSIVFIEVAFQNKTMLN